MRVRPVHKTEHRAPSAPLSQPSARGRHVAMQAVRDPPAARASCWRPAAGQPGSAERADQRPWRVARRAPWANVFPEPIFKDVVMSSQMSPSSQMATICVKTLRKLPILRMFTQIYTMYAIHDLRINAKITHCTQFTQKS